MPMLCAIATHSIWGNDRGVGGSKHDIALVWDPTFTHFERFILFWKAPIVIYIFNLIVSWTITLIFSEYFIGFSPINQSSQQYDLPVSWQEIVIMIYCKKHTLKRPAMFQPPCSPASLSKLLAELTCDAVCRHLCAHSRDLAVSSPGRQCGLFESVGGSEEEGPRIFYGLLEYH